MNTLRTTLLGIFTVLAFQGQAQVLDSTLWKSKLSTGLNFNQAAFSDSWTGGGVNSFGFLSYFKWKGDYKKEKNSWSNTVDLQFGLISNEGQRFQRKSADLIFIDTKYGHAISEKWDWILSANFLSQFTKGYEFGEDSIGRETRTLISDFLTPGYLTVSWGFEYHPTDYFKLRLSPFAPRFTFRSNDDVDRDYGVEPGNTVRTEWLAAQILAEFDKEIAKNLNLSWRYILFANYETFALDEIDHRLDVTLKAKVNTFMDVAVAGVLLYDKDQVDQVQWSQALTLGIYYTLQNYTEE